MKKIAILLENIFDEQELIYPYHRLREDFEVVLVGTEGNTVYTSKEGFTIKSDVASKDISAEDFDGVFIPGGFSPDYMRRCDATVDFVKKLYEANKPVGAICHGPWVLASALDLKGKNLTSFFSIKDDLIHAGANWIDNECVVDGNLVTGRNPGDLPAVIKKFISLIEK